MSETVQDLLQRRAHARRLHVMELGLDRRVTIWENSFDRVTYDAPQGHAFSLYLKGGTGTRRLDHGGIAGSPGVICILPDGHHSDWEIEDAFQFVHLYLPDEEIRAAYSQTFDRDARSLDVPEATFLKDARLAGLLSGLAQACVEQAPLMADQQIAELVHLLPEKSLALKGGLAPFMLKRLDDWMDAHLDQTVRLEDLAQEANLSEFHFHRMFKASRGVSAHQWLTMHRIARAKRLIATTSLAEVAVACGFANQSHLSRTFKRHTGLSPAAFRKEQLS